MFLKLEKRIISTRPKRISKTAKVRCYTNISFITLITMKSQSKVFFAWGRLNLVDSAPDVLLKCVFNPK